MPSSDNEEFDPLSLAALEMQADSHAKFDTLLVEITNALAEHGIVTDEMPDKNAYLAKLEIDPDDTGDALLEAVISYNREETSRGIDHVILLFLVGMLSMNRIMGKTPEHVRKMVIRSLWESEHWSPGWEAVLDIYTPGPNPTADEVSELNDLIRLKNESASEHLQASLAKVDELELILSEYGTLAIEDQSVKIMGLMSIADIRKASRNSMASKDRPDWLRNDLGSHIRKMGADPKDPGWQAVIENLSS